MVKPIDLYVAQTNNMGRFYALRWSTEHNIYIPELVKVEAPIRGNIRIARMNRKQWIAEQEAAGLVVKSVRSIGSVWGGMVKELYHSKFERGKRMSTMKEVLDYLYGADRKGDGNFMISPEKKPENDYVYSPSEHISIGTVGKALETNGLYTAIRKIG